MSLLTQSSLVLIPSGYKEDTVYSVIPSNGSGDMSFTRASDGTRINSDGLVEVCPWNLLPNSQTFASWNKVQIGTTITVTDNFVTAPNGTLTGAKVVFSTFSDLAQIFQNYSLSPTQNLTATLYAKVPSGTKQAYIGFYDGAVKTQLKTLTTEWQRIEYTGSIDAGTVRACWFYGEGGASNVEVHLWGGQFNIGSTAKPYFPTTDRLNVPRLTYQNGGGGCPSLLLEPQRTNLLTYSNTFSNAAWFKNSCTISVNSIISPDATQNGSKLVEGTANDSHHIYQNVISSGQNTFTFYAKQGERKFVYAYAEGAGQGKCFDLENGTVGANIIASPTSSSITPAGNGWYRCSITITIVVATALRIGTCSADGTFSYLGNGTSGIYIYGAQVEVGSYATSYIPTLAASATRIADACLSIGTPLLLNDFSFFMSIKFSQVNQGLGYMLFGSVNSASISRIYIDSGANLSFTTLTTTTAIGVSGLSINTDYKICFTRSGTTLKYFRNGALINTFTVQSEQFNFTTFCNAVDSGGVTSKYNTLGLFSQGIVFTNALTNAEAITLTTI